MIVCTSELRVFTSLRSCRQVRSPVTVGNHVRLLHYSVDPSSPYRIARMAPQTPGSERALAPEYRHAGAGISMVLTARSPAPDRSTCLVCPPSRFLSLAGLLLPSPPGNHLFQLLRQLSAIFKERQEAWYNTVWLEGEHPAPSAAHAVCYLVSIVRLQSRKGLAPQLNFTRL